MKLFRRISALALVLVLVCTFGASVFAVTITDSITRYGITMNIYASVGEKYVSADSSLDTGDAIGNYLYIDVWCDYYIQGASGNLYLVNVTDDDAADRVAVATDTWDCYLTYSPPDVYKMHFAEVTFDGEHSSSYYGYVDFPSASYPVNYYG